MQLEESEVDYLVDMASLVQLSDNANWRDEANARIDALRKNDITLK